MHEQKKQQQCFELEMTAQSYGPEQRRGYLPSFQPSPLFQTHKTNRRYGEGNIALAIAIQSIREEGR